jgi:hypothetical protein
VEISNFSFVGGEKEKPPEKEEKRGAQKKNIS